MYTLYIYIYIDTIEYLYICLSIYTLYIYIYTAHNKFLHTHDKMHTSNMHKSWSYLRGCG